MGVISSENGQIQSKTQIFKIDKMYFCKLFLISVHIQYEFLALGTHGFVAVLAHNSGGRRTLIPIAPEAGGVTVIPSRAGRSVHTKT